MAKRKNYVLVNKSAFVNGHLYCSAFWNIISKKSVTNNTINSGQNKNCFCYLTAYFNRATKQRPDL